MEINKSDNMVIERFKALVLDLLIICIPQYFIMVFLTQVILNVFKIEYDYNVLISVYGITNMILIFCYFVYTESSKNHTSYGKKRFNLYIASKNGGDVKLGQVILRNIIKFMPLFFNYFYTIVFELKYIEYYNIALKLGQIGTLSFVILLIGFCLTDRNNGLHNVLSNTRIIKARYII